ncbi:MAG: ComF family protein [Pseudomonadota bacterium]
MLDHIRAASGRAAYGVLNLVLPPRCLACGGGVEAPERLCPACWSGLTFLEKPQCRLCGYPLPHAVPSAPLCGNCAAEPPVYDRARAALRYDEGSRGLILAFKHADRTDTAPAFGRWLARAGADLLRGADLVTPVPLHRWRLLKRGYNQAEILARALARETGIKLAPDLVQRVRSTASQQGLGGRARLENITSGAFRVHPWHRHRAEGARILLIDDVLTTGSTVEACVRVLRRAGAAQVDVLTLARVVRDASHPI